MSDPGERKPIRHRAVLPPNLEGGIYANRVDTWHSEHEFTLDFGVQRLPRLLDPEDDESE